MDIDVHRQGVPTAQYRVMRQIQVEQMAAARSRGRIVPAIRQVGEVGDYIDVFRRAPAFGTRRIDGDRAKSHSQNARQQVLGNPFEVARVSVQRSAFLSMSSDRPYSAANFARMRSKSVILAVLSSTCVADARIDSSSLIPLSCDVPMRCSDSGEPGSDDGFRSTRKPVVCNGIYVDFIMIATRRKRICCIGVRFV